MSGSTDDFPPGLGTTRCSVSGGFCLFRSGSGEGVTEVSNEGEATRLSGGVDQEAIKVKGKVLVVNGDEGEGVDRLVVPGKDAAGKGEGGVLEAGVWVVADGNVHSWVGGSERRRVGEDDSGELGVGGMIGECG